MDAKRIRATIIEEQRKDPFLKLIIEKLQSKYAVEGGLEKLSASRAAETNEDSGTQVISEAQQDNMTQQREKGEMGGTPTAEAQANADAQDEQADEEETGDLVQAEGHGQESSRNARKIHGKASEVEDRQIQTRW